jgi:hypothetical protein
MHSNEHASLNIDRLNCSSAAACRATGIKLIRFLDAIEGEVPVGKIVRAILHK